MYASNLIIVLSIFWLQQTNAERYRVTVNFTSVGYRNSLADKNNRDFVQLSRELKAAIESLYEETNGTETVHILQFRAGSSRQSLLTTFEIDSVGNRQGVIVDVEDRLNAAIDDGTIGNFTVSRSGYLFERLTVQSIRCEICGHVESTSRHLENAEKLVHSLLPERHGVRNCAHNQICGGELFILSAIPSRRDTRTELNATVTAWIRNCYERYRNNNCYGLLHVGGLHSSAVMGLKEGILHELGLEIRNFSLCYCDTDDCNPFFRSNESVQLFGNCSDNLSTFPHDQTTSFDLTTVVQGSAKPAPDTSAATSTVSKGAAGLLMFIVLLFKMAFFLKKVSCVQE